MKIKVGDTVETLDDAITGKVVRIKGNTVVMVSEDDFEFEFGAHELIKIEVSEDVDLGSLSDTTIHEVKQQKDASKKRKVPSVKPKERSKATFVVDLHIHQLIDSTKGMTNFDMLNLQLDTAKRQLEFAIKKRILKMVFIHGVGEGVLKQELYTLLGRYDNVKYYDADYKTYGLGATEVRIFQNVVP